MRSICDGADESLPPPTRVEWHKDKEMGLLFKCIWSPRPAWTATTVDELVTPTSLQAVDLISRRALAHGSCIRLCE